MSAPILRLAARRDIRAAAIRYRQDGGPGVAERFVAAVEQAVAHLVHHPEAGSPAWQDRLQRSGLRAWPVKGFPYLIFYRLRGRQPDILRVLHTARDIPKGFHE